MLISVLQLQSFEKEFESHLCCIGNIFVVGFEKKKNWMHFSPKMKKLEGVFDMPVMAIGVWTMKALT